MEHKDLVRLTADVVSAWAAHNPATPEELVGAIAAVHRAFETVGAAPAQAKETPVPAVPIRKSVTPDYLICLEDGRKLKMLKRYLRTAYNMSPEEYRTRPGQGNAGSGGADPQVRDARLPDLPRGRPEAEDAQALSAHGL